MERFTLVTVVVSAQDIYAHFRRADLELLMSEEELLRITDMTFKYVTTAEALEAYANMVAGRPGVN